MEWFAFTPAGVLCLLLAGFFMLKLFDVAAEKYYERSNRKPLDPDALNREVPAE